MKKSSIHTSLPKMDISRINSPDEWMHAFMRNSEPAIKVDNKIYTMKLLTGKPINDFNGHGQIFSYMRKNITIPLDRMLKYNKQNKLESDGISQGYELADGTYITKADVATAWENFEAMKAELTEKIAISKLRLIIKEEIRKLIQ